MAVEAPPAGARHFLLTGAGWPYLLVPLIPVAIAVGIAIGSSAQIASFAAPPLVLFSFMLGPFPMVVFFAV